jgi:hypothetical protein
MRREEEGAGHRHWRVQSLVLEELRALLRDDVSDPALRLVHRKGAVAVPSGAMALVPGSMGTASYVVEGDVLDDQRDLVWRKVRLEPMAVLKG